MRPVREPDHRVSGEQPFQLLADALRSGPGREAAAGEHLVLLVDQFPRVLGGGERVVLRLARLLTGAGYRVSIVTFQVLCGAEVLRDLPCPVYLLPLQNVFSGAALRAAWQFGRFLRQGKVSIVMTFFESSNLFGGLVTKGLSNAKLIWNRRDMGILRESKHRAAYRLLPRLPDYVIAVSEEVRRHAVEADRIPADRVGVVYNGLDSTAEPETRSIPDWPIVVTVGNLRPVKGQDVLVEAAALVLRERPEVHFWIAGEALDRAYFDQLQQRVRELALENRVNFLGSVADPRPLLRQASLFVLPSRSEGFSNAIVEAMLAGLPVVATTVGGNAEAVVDGETGLLVPPEQPQTMAAALLHLLNDPERMQRMGDAGQRRAQTCFSAEGMLRQLREIFTRLQMPQR